MAMRLKIRDKKGFTLVEVLVAIMIVGILISLSSPQLFRIVEKNKASEAVNLFFSLKGAQDRYKAKYGGYCIGGTCSGFDVTPPTLRYFNPGTGFVVGGTGTNQSWKLTLTRTNAPMVYGSYQITYDIEPGAAPLLTCNQSNCMTDLLPIP